MAMCNPEEQPHIILRGDPQWQDHRGSVIQVSQVELARYERQQSRKGAALPQAEALLLATQQADAIYSQAFQELALQVQQV